MSNRIEKVNSLLQKEISAYIFDQRFEGIKGLVTVKGVVTSRDLGHAKIFVSVVGQNEESILEILNKHIGQIQKMLYERLRMTPIPRISFVLDHSGEYAEYISKLLNDIHSNDSK